MNDPVPRPYESILGERPRRSRLQSFVIGGVCGLLPVLVLAFIPLGNTSGRNARQAEGQQLLGSARDSARVWSAKGEGKPRTLRGVLRGEGPMQGQFYRIVDVVALPHMGGGRIYAVPLDYYNPTMRIDFDWKSGRSEIVYLGPKLDWP